MSTSGDAGAEKTAAKKKIIEIRHNGEGKDFAFRPEQKVHKLLEEAITAFGATGAVHTLALYDGDGEELTDEQQTLAEAGVEAGDVLRLRTSKVKGGAALAVGEGLLPQTLSIVRACGAGRAECVVFWAGPVGRPDAVDTVLHPDHRSGRGGYEVSEEWLTRMWERLDEEGLAIRAQVHTHPFEAFHSATDDAYPILATVGFLSLVLPRFGEEPQDLADAYLARLEADGSFAEVDLFDTLGSEVAGMSSVPALDRTIALLQGDLFPTLDAELLAREAVDVHVAIGADRGNLRSPAAQTALVTAFLAIAQYGARIHLDIPDVAIAGPQPPLRGTRLRSALLDLASDLITPAVCDPAPPGTLEILVGDTATTGDGTVLRLGGATFRAQLRVGRDARVDPFRGEAPLGAVLVGIAAAAETMRMTVRDIRDRHDVPVAEVFDLGGPRDVDLELPAFELPPSLDIGRVDFVSGGAITNACLFVLLRVAGLRGAARVMDADLGEETNLNRYGLLRRSDLGRAKVGVLGGHSRPAGLSIEPLELRLERATAAEVMPLAPSVVCGVDDIPSRWLVQGMRPAWLCVGGTSHFTVLVSEHGAGMPCAGCLHPEDDLDAPAELPTISFTSLLAGALQAHRLLAHAGGAALADPTLGASFNLRAPHALEEIPVAARSDCPVGCAESRAVSRRGDGSGEKSTRSGPLKAATELRAAPDLHVPVVWI